MEKLRSATDRLEFLFWVVAFWVWHILISIDQLANVVFCFGSPDETISSRFGKWSAYGMKSKCKPCKFVSVWVCKALDKIDPDHCAKSIEEDETDLNVIPRARIKVYGK